MRSDLARFAARRLVSMIVVLFAVSVLVFLIFNVLPAGDPAVRMAGKTPEPAEIEAIRKEWGFDRSLPVQYVTMMGKLASGDMISYFTRLDVTEEIRKGIPRTLSLALGAALIWMAFAVGLGLYAALREGRAADRLVTILAIVGVSLPAFWLGAVLSHYLGYELGLFPNGGYVELTVSPPEWLWHMILPWTTLAALYIGFYARVLRGEILETLGEEHVRAARAKGLPERRVLGRHVLRNSLLGIVTLWGLDFGAVVGGGAILTETVFDLQGVGQYAAESVSQLDLPPVLAVTMYGAFFIVALNAFVDIAYAALDPRIRLGEGRR